MYNFFIGVDPAFRAGGFSICIIDKAKKSVNFKTFKNGFLGFCNWFLNDAPKVGNVLFCVENSNLTRATFDTRGNTLIVARKSRNVGKNQAISQNTADLIRSKYPLIDLSPAQKGRKWTAEQFKRVADSEGHTIEKKRTNQDERDAYKLALIALEKPYLAK
tara:strand:+ start:1192 stop:1674 length:483 start_codon:yes stop_codon:yes gene_type:complete